MIGSIDCMHWVWDKCPVAWHGEHKGHFHKPTIILEAVASYNLRFWHCFFGLPGSLNDINVLNRSPVFDDLASGNAPQFNFNVNDHSYDMDTTWLMEYTQTGLLWLKVSPLLLLRSSSFSQ